MEISKNFLNTQDITNIQNTLTSPYFPWYYNEGVVKKNDGQAQLVHTFFDKDRNYINSDYYSLFEPLIKKINPFVLLRIKANLSLKTEKPIQQGFHVDYSTKNDLTTALFYVNTNNGHTIFENGKKVKSVANTLIEFNGKTSHTGVSCTDILNRLVINLNYIR